MSKQYLGRRFSFSYLSYEVQYNVFPHRLLITHFSYSLDKCNTMLFDAKISSRKVMAWYIRWIPPTQSFWATSTSSKHQILNIGEPFFLSHWYSTRWDACCLLYINILNIYCKTCIYTLHHPFSHR